LLRWLSLLLLMFMIFATPMMPPGRIRVVVMPDYAMPLAYYARHPRAAQRANSWAMMLP